MARLAYSAITSLDLYVNDADGGFAWAAPDEEVHAYVNDLERPYGTYLFGRRMYETMRYWETNGDGPDDGEISRDYATLWRAADKIVFSTTLEEVSTERTRLERRFAPEAIRALKEEAGADISVGGAGLAGQALAAGLVDDLHLLLCPVLVGGGTPALPDGVRRDLELVDERRFGGGVVHLHLRVR